MDGYFLKSAPKYGKWMIFGGLLSQADPIIQVMEDHDRIYGNYD
jgi:hypothetical protein